MFFASLSHETIDDDNVEIDVKTFHIQKWTEYV